MSTLVRKSTINRMLANEIVDFVLKSERSDFHDRYVVEEIQRCNSIAEARKIAFNHVYMKAYYYAHTKKDFNDLVARVYREVKSEQKRRAKL